MPSQHTDSLPSTGVAEFLQRSLQGARHQPHPFDHWLLNNALPPGCCEAISALPMEPPEDAVFDGRRETNNTHRVYFTPANQRRHEVCQQLSRGFQDPRVKQAIEQTTATDLTDCRLRIEYCQDTEGFWLAPHTDISVKKFTMLVYLLDDPGLARAGTDILAGPPDHQYIASAPYGKNKGVLFIPGENTWHGAGHHRFSGLRKSIIINFVTPQWRDQWQLAG